MKISKLSLLSLSFSLLYSEIGFANPSCKEAPKSKEAAVACAKNEIFSNAQEVYNFASLLGHTGDVKKCEETKDTSSYFTNDESAFVTGIQLNTITCEDSNQDPDAFSCQVRGIPGCSIRKPEMGKPTEKACFRLGKTSGKFYSFYPIRPALSCN